MKKLAILAVVAVLVGLPSWAAADSVTYPATPIPVEITDWTNNIYFLKFDPSMGTLYQIDLTLTASLDTVLSITTTNHAEGEAQTRISVDVSGAGGHISGRWMTDTFPSDVWYYDVYYPDTQYSSSFEDSYSKKKSYTDTGTLQQFTGTDNIALSAQTTTGTVIYNYEGNYTASQTTYAGLDGTIKYYYNTVPIPASVLLLGSGLVGLLALARRKKKPAAQV